MRAGFAVVLVALAVPAAALAWNHHGYRHHGHAYVHQGATGSNSVTSYSDGTLVLAASNGTSITGLVTRDTHFQCVGAGWRDGSWRRGRRFGRRNSPLDSSGPTGPTGPTGSSGGTGTTGTGGPTGGSGYSGGGPTGGGGWGGGGSTGGRGWGGTQPGYGHGRGDQGGHGRSGHGHHGSTGGSGGSSSGNYVVPPPCDSSLLVPGAMISSAEVLITPAGVEFGEIVLLPVVQ
jgi:hypothetical protein